MLKNNYLERIRLYQNDFSDSLNTMFVVCYAQPNAFGTSQIRETLNETSYGENDYTQRII